MIYGLQKSVALYYRRLATQAAAAEEEVLNRQIVHDFDIPESHRFNPDFFPGFLVDPDEAQS